VIRFELPSLGADMDAGTLLQWHVQPGDTVKRGQVVAVVDTSKAAVDVEIWQDGVVAELLVQPGEKIPVGTVLATLLEPGESPGALPESKTGTGPVPTPAPAPATPQPAERPPPAVAAATASAVPATRRAVSPSARQRARELGIDPDQLQGTGMQGSVTLADVEAAARSAPAATVQVPAAVGPADRAREMRNAIAAAMSRSKREIPHYYLSETIPMARALAWLRERNQDKPVTERLLPAVLLLKAVALALRRTPELNGFHRDGRFEPAAAAHVGVAISLRGGGLVAPALHDVGARALDTLMRELTDLVRRARAGSLRSSEMSDPTITVTNLGDQGVDAVFGVIYPPQVALVGFGRVVERPWVVDGAVLATPVVCASLAADHRASDGHRGALFLAELHEWLQQPQELDATAPATVRPQGDAP
jgi:pyruvate dehydrogenase E2 component (dihydrolipoamide acetyltransferase)